MARNILVCMGEQEPHWMLRTVWALCFGRNEGFLPLEVHVLATRVQALQIQDKLLHPEQGKFVSFVREYGLEGEVILDQERILLLSKDGKPIDRIENQRDFYAAGRCILDTVSTLCSDPGTRVFGNLSGGKNSMGLYLAVALSLFGRGRDRLLHTTVHSALEAHSDFYYPSRIPRSYTVVDPASKSPHTLSCAEARINLVSVPLPFLSQVLYPQDLAQVKLSFYPDAHQDGHVRQSAAHAAANQNAAAEQQASSGPARLDPVHDRVMHNGLSCTLTPMEGALYHYLADRKMACSNDAPCGECDRSCFVSPWDLDTQFLISRLEEKWGAFSARLDNFRAKIAKDIALDAWFLQHRSRVNRKIGRSGLPYSLCIVSNGIYGASAYGSPHEKSQLLLADHTKQD